jgi:hypothetical protein
MYCRSLSSKKQWHDLSLRATGKDRNLLPASALTWLSKIVACSEAGMARMTQVSCLLLVVGSNQTGAINKIGHLQRTTASETEK